MEDFSLASCYTAMLTLGGCPHAVVSAVCRAHREAGPRDVTHKLARGERYVAAVCRWTRLCWASTPAVDRDLVAEAPRTVGRADETDLRQRGRPFLLRLPESADGGNP
jgi:hypothetical protein